MKRLYLLLTLTIIPLVTDAQVDYDSYWHDYIELWAEQNESETVPDDLIETLELLRDNPVNINDTSSDRLFLLPFVTEFQRDVIKDYILQNGPFYSLAELNILNGFDSVTLRLLRPLVYVGPANPAPLPTLKVMLTQGRSNLLMGIRHSIERSRGYNEGIYPGDPYRAYFRYSYRYGEHLHFQISGDKDPGEEFFTGSQPQGFDHYGYHLMLNDFGRLRSAIVGKYNLQFGQGTTLWSGYAPWATNTTNQQRYAQGIRPAGAMSEYGYLRGVAATVRLWQHTELTAFYSYTNLDATRSTDDTSCIQSLYNSGNHRTPTELDKRDQQAEQLFGAHLEWNRDRLSLGLTAYQSFYEKTILPHDYIYNHYTFAGNDNLVAGINASYCYRRALFYGELSLSHNTNTHTFFVEQHTLPLAGMMGTQFFINSDNKLSLSYRNYSSSYQNMHSAANGQNSTNQNEEGTTLCFETKLPGLIHITATADFFRFPYMRYATYAASWGTEYRLLLSRDITRHSNLSAQYRYKSRGKNASLTNIDTTIQNLAPLEEEHSYIVEQTLRRQLLFRLDYTPWEVWKFSSRLILTWFDCEYHIPQRGYLLLQDVSYTTSSQRRPITITGRCAWFDITGYDARIYVMESDFTYESATPGLQGRGIRCYLVARCNLSPHWSVGAKYALSHYPDRETMGSGYDLIQGNIKQEIKIQLRLKW